MTVLQVCREIGWLHCINGGAMVLAGLTGIAWFIAVRR